MTEQDAYDLLDFIQQRIFGWTIVMGCDNPSGRMDGRYAKVKAANRLFRDTFLFRSSFKDCAQALQNDEDPALQWPEQYRDFVRFCLWHRCPRTENEPLDDREGKWPQPRGLPDFLRQYDKPATLADMPPMPEASIINKLNEGQTS